MLLATTTVEDFDRFNSVFGTKGAEKRKQHGSKGTLVSARYEAYEERHVRHNQDRRCCVPSSACTLAPHQQICKHRQARSPGHPCTDHSRFHHGRLGLT